MYEWKATSIQKVGIILFPSRAWACCSHPTKSHWTQRFKNAEEIQVLWISWGPRSPYLSPSEIPLEKRDTSWGSHQVDSCYGCWEMGRVATWTREPTVFQPMRAMFFNVWVNGDNKMISSGSRHIFLIPVVMNLFLWPHSIYGTCCWFSILLQWDNVPF